MIKFRKHWACALLGMSLVVGCGGGSTPATSTGTSRDREAGATADKGTSQAAGVAAAEPQLEAVPEQSEPGEADFPRGSVAFKALVAAAQSNDADAWSKSETKLQELGVHATAALAAHLDDENVVARELAAMFLAQIGPEAASAANGLLKLLNDESTFARVNAAAALSTFEGHAEKVAPVLTQLLADEDENVRLTAATSLRNLGPEAGKSVMGLSKALRDPNAQVRAAAATTLGEIGPDAIASLPALRQLRSDSEEAVVAAAARAIRRIDESSRDSASLATPASATE